MSKSIIICSSLFSSVYLMSTSLRLINKSLLENKKIPNELIIINGLSFMMSSSIFIGLTLYNLTNLKFSRGIKTFF